MDIQISPERITSLAIPSQQPVAPPTGLILDPSELPERYGMVVKGSCMEPEIFDGAQLLLDKTAAFKPGDLVILWKRPEVMKPGQLQAIVKRLYMVPPPWVTFPYREHAESDVRALLFAEQLNPPSNFAIPCEHLLAVHRCVGVMREIANGIPDGNPMAGLCRPTRKC